MKRMQRKEKKAGTRREKRGSEKKKRSKVKWSEVRGREEKKEIDVMREREWKRDR